MSCLMLLGNQNHVFLAVHNKCWLTFQLDIVMSLDGKGETSPVELIGSFLSHVLTCSALKNTFSSWFAADLVLVELATRHPRLPW